MNFRLLYSFFRAANYCLQLDRQLLLAFLFALTSNLTDTGYLSEIETGR